MAVTDFEISCCIAVFTGYCEKLKPWWTSHAVLLSDLCMKSKVIHESFKVAENKSLDVNM